MPSLTAAVLNAALRILVKPRLRRGLSVESVRNIAATLDRWLVRGAPTRAGDPVVADGVPCEWFAPRVDEKRWLLYLHGGGFMVHLPRAYRMFARRLADLLGARVLVPEYRLAPEHCFPAGPDDCIATYRWLLAQGYDPKRIVIAGDSAGGNLALVTAMRIRDENLPAPACVVMLSPATDLGGASASLSYNRDSDPMLIPEALQIVVANYVGEAALTHPWISPIYDSFQGLPPLLFHAGSSEILVDDSIRAADKARWAGTRATLDVWPHMPHVFQMTPWLPEADVALEAIARFVLDHVPAPAAQ